MPTVAYTLHPISFVLEESLEYIRKNYDHPYYEFILKDNLKFGYNHGLYRLGMIDSSFFNPEEMKAVSNPDPAVVNKFLEENGIDVRLSGKISNLKFYAAALMEFLFAWGDKNAESATIHSDEKFYSGFELKNNVEFFYLPFLSNSVACIGTGKDEDVFVYMPPKGVSIGSHEMLKTAQYIVDSYALDSSI